MESRFVIQASNPRALREFDAEDESLSDAIQTVFPPETEHAVLTWNWVYVPLGYKYDLAMMAEDVVFLLETMTASPQGTQRVDWPSNTFASTWRSRGAAIARRSRRASGPSSAAPKPSSKPGRRWSCRPTTSWANGAGRSRSSRRRRGLLYR